MKIHFYKYQGTGNDFVVLDNRNWQYSALSQGQIQRLCDRRFGVGADGLMLLNSKINYDFEMVYFNADGKPSSMCGNGGRCIVQFARDLGMVHDRYFFCAIDGDHEAEILPDGRVQLKMNDVSQVRQREGDWILNTGSPHYVKLVSDVLDIDVFRDGMEIRYSAPFAPGGVNVNFVEVKSPDTLYVRTYERGVEDETFSCGTGVVASALAASEVSEGSHEVRIQTKGGDLSVRFDRKKDHFENIWLVGPAVKVFEGDLEG